MSITAIELQELNLRHAKQAIDTACMGVCFAGIMIKKICMIDLIKVGARLSGCCSTCL